MLPSFSSSWVVEHDVNLKPMNTFGLHSIAKNMVRIHADNDVRRLIDDPVLGPAPKFILGGGSNVIVTKNINACVLRIEVMGKQCIESRSDAWIIEVGAGESWHHTVQWCLANGYPGLENLALIPGTVGAAPVQNIGAYGVELQDRLESVDAVDLITGQSFTLQPEQCHFGYRQSIFKGDLAGKCVITRVRFRLPKPWQPVLGYLDLARKASEAGVSLPDAKQIFDWVCAIRQSKLPDSNLIGNVGSFFKNPVVSQEQCQDIIGRDPKIVHYLLDDGSYKLAAGWMIDACGWRGKSIGQAGVYEKQALVLINRGGANGQEVLTLAHAIQESVYGRFGIRLEPEPIFW